MAFDIMGKSFGDKTSFLTASAAAASTAEHDFASYHAAKYYLGELKKPGCDSRRAMGDGLRIYAAARLHYRKRGQYGFHQIPGE